MVKTKIKTMSPQNLKEKIKKLRKKNIFFILGKKSYIKSGAEKIFSELVNRSQNTKYFKTKQYPEISELKKITKKIKTKKPELIIAIGGGAVIDLAKSANYLSNCLNLKKQILHAKKNYDNYCKLVVIPTTAGSGAEVTANSVIYINKVKYSVENSLLKPHKFYLIPNFVKNSNSNLKAAAGFDAISQAVESLFSLRGNQKSLMYAVNSLKLSLKNYLPYLKRASIENSKKMLVASNLSGKAISISKTTAPHAISYPFTSHYNISHGKAVAITFNDILKFNYFNKDRSLSKFNLDDRFKILFKLTQTQNIFELDKFFSNLKKNAKIKDSFLELNINPSQSIRYILREVNQKRLSNNPIHIDFESLRKILLIKK